MKNSRGLTMVELVIVVLIVGILAAIALPMYRGYLQRARRVDAKTALEQVRAVQEMWRAEKGSYSIDGTLVELQTTLKAPANPVGYYNWSFTVLNANSFTAQAVPVGGGPQVSDGSLFINQDGQKWDSGGKYYPDRDSKWSR